MRKLIGALVVIIGLAAPPVVAAEEMVPTVVVLDASGSMTAPDVGGQTRMDAAKQATRDFVDSTPDKAPLGLLTYGTGTGSSDAEKEAGCRDITVLGKPGEKTKAELKGEVDRLNPRGYTPIGNALLKADEQLPQEGERAIVLVSDGVDTCAPPPVCEVAKQLKDKGTDLVVHTIGFMVDEAARAELKCVADVTGGTYADASSAESLKATLTKATTRTAVGYQLPEQTVNFSDNKTDAPMVDVGTLEKPARMTAKIPNEAKTYAKVTVPDGHRLHIGFTIPPTGVGTKGIDGDRRSLHFSVSDPESGQCSIGETASDLSGGIAIEGYTISEVVGAKNGCTSNVLYLETEAVWKKNLDVDLTLTAVPEPTEPGKPSTKRDNLGAPAPAADPKPAQAANHPDPAAPEYTGTITSEIVEGETQYFATPVKNGQALDITAEILDDPSAKDQDPFEDAGRLLDFGIINALGQPQDIVEFSRSMHVSTDEPFVMGTTYPVALANSAKNDIMNGTTAWLGGKHYVRVSFPSYFREKHTDATTQLKPVKYRLTFTPVGEEAAAPTLETQASGNSEKTEASEASEASTSAPTSNTGKYIAGGIFALAAVAIGVAVAGIIRGRR